MRPYPLLIVVALIVSFSSCNKTDQVPEKTEYVFTAGYYKAGGYRIPCYWKDSTRYTLPCLDNTKGGSAWNIFVNNNDVYVTGDNYDASGIAVPCYWKNGVRTDLSRIDNSKHGSAQTFGIMANGDIYIAGSTRNSLDRVVACYWKNGVRTDLPVPATTVYSSSSAMQIAGDNVYIGGRYTNGGIDVACYWKNGIRTDVTDPNNTGLSDMNISGTDQYLVGYYQIAAPPYTTTACYWKNGTRTDMPVATYNFDITSSISISGTDVFISGFYNNNNTGTPCYWKNGIRTDLSVLANHSHGYAMSIFVNGSDIYIGGYCLDFTSGDVVA